MPERCGAGACTEDAVRSYIFEVMPGHVHYCVEHAEENPTDEVIEGESSFVESECSLCVTSF